MNTAEKKIDNDATKIVHTLCAFVLAIVLGSSYTGLIGWEWTVLTAVVIGVVAIVNTVRGVVAKNPGDEVAECENGYEDESVASRQQG